MSKIRRLITIFIPLQRCNLKCEYCYITQLDAWNEPEKPRYSAQHIAKCLSKERLGGECLINFTADGETLLQPDLHEIVEEVLKEGHYVEIVTNGVITNRLEKILSIDNSLLPRLEFKISFHYKELMRLDILNRFFDNVQMIKDAGASFTLELMAYDGIEDDVEEIKRVCIEKAGAACHATIGRDEKTIKRTLLTDHTQAEFRDIWRTLDSAMMDVKFELLDVKRKEFCYAGCWSLYVNMYTGETEPCYWVPANQNIFENPNKPIRFNPVGYMCPSPYCINGHAHLTLGLIPELELPTYNDIRNRECHDDRNWLTPEGEEFYSSHLYETNEEFSKPKKVLYTISEPFRLAKWLVTDPKTKKRARNLFNRYINRTKK